MTSSTAANDIAALVRECSNVDRWGQADQLGTLNLINKQTRRRALSLIKSGEVVSLARSMKDGDRGVRLRVTNQQANGSIISASDILTIEQHGYAITHLDSITHSFVGGRAFVGQPLSQGSAKHSSIAAAAALGIVTRAILLDVAGARGVEHLVQGEGVGRSDLEAAEALAGVAIEPGDAVFVRTGLSLRVAKGGEDDPALREGLTIDAIPWLRARDVAVYAGDCIERLPSGLPDLPLPLHQIGMAAMGLWMLDNPNVEVLRDACRRHGTSAFALVVAPLPIDGATGSPVNPLALF